MTAVPRLVDDESSHASPELALVDSVLAAELRRGLRLVADTWVPPRVQVEEAPTAIEEAPTAIEEVPTAVEEVPTAVEEAPTVIEEDEPAEQDLGGVLGRAVPREVEPFGNDDYIVEVIDDDYIVEVSDDTSAQHANPHYPVLPSPKSGQEGIEETDAALRQIRERMVDEVPARKTRLRRRFTVASGASVVVALCVLAVDVQLQVAQLPAWLRF
jgi:hypothetical protein